MPKFGRKPRGYDKRIPQMSMLRARQALPPLPSSVNYADGMPANLGVMLNDTLGDCVPAACGHAVQVWTFNADGSANMVTPSDADIEAFYERAGGYIPGNPNTDNGTIIQVALTDWLNTPVDSNELAAFVEIDQRDSASMQRAIWESGVVDIGFNVPNYLPTVAGSVWDVDPSADNTIIGGHSVILVGYDMAKKLYQLKSWGLPFAATQAFIDKFCDEAYALGNPAWIEETGLSPAGLTLAELEALMQSMVSNPNDNVSPHHRRHHQHHRKYRHHRNKRNKQ